MFVISNVEKSLLITVQCSANMTSISASLIFPKRTIASKYLNNTKNICDKNF